MFSCILISNVKMDTSYNVVYWVKIFYLLATSRALFFVWFIYVITSRTILINLPVIFGISVVSLLSVSTSTLCVFACPLFHPDISFY